MISSLQNQKDIYGSIFDGQFLFAVLDLISCFGSCHDLTSFLVSGDDLISCFGSRHYLTSFLVSGDDLISGHHLFPVIEHLRRIRICQSDCCFPVQAFLYCLPGLVAFYAEKSL
uniref:Uncharacterized protein n=1 Tax=Cacopsylla melanoneura TaxID=428564 RepID=A0A8D8M4L2_9HEMI